MPVTITPLSHMTVLLAHGSQAADLLQAQLTQEIHKWPEDTARMAAFCTPQGRMLADFLLWKASDGGIAMALDASLADATLKRLRLFILRLQCKVDDASAEQALFGVLQPPGEDSVLGPDAWPCPAEPWSVQRREGIALIRLPDAPNSRRLLLVSENALGLREIQRLRTQIEEGTKDDWTLSEVRAGIGHVTAATAQQFVPQMLNYEALGAVDFKKGCYPGQEIVARTQYRGTIKRRSYRLVGPGPLAAGDEIFQSDDPTQPCGMVVEAAPATENWEALAELKITATTTPGTFHARSLDGPELTLSTLPYTLPPQD